VIREESRHRGGSLRSLRMVCPRKVARDWGFSFFFPLGAVSSEAHVPFCNPGFHLRGSLVWCSAGLEQDPSSLRNVGPALGTRQAECLLQSQARTPSCLHPTLRQDPVSKSPESHFLPQRSAPPLPVNHRELAFAPSSDFLKCVCNQ
jgi:hypothetical protein